MNFEEQRAKRNRNVLIMAIAIVLGVALSWFPKSVMELLMLFSQGPEANYLARPHFTCLSPLSWLAQIVPSTRPSVLLSVGIS